MSLKLGVNIDHVATLRQARYATMLDSPNAEPSPVDAALRAKAGGADSITLHVRGDRRHIQEADAFAIRERVDLPLNLEMAAVPEMVDLARRLQPDYVCIVPEKREEVTTEGGLGVAGNEEQLRKVVQTLQEAGSEVSMFIDPDLAQVEASAAVGAEMVELHTGCFANAGSDTLAAEIERLQAAALKARSCNLRVNAGHGINYENVSNLFSVSTLIELNIGHSIVSRALYVGMQQAVEEMRALMNGYPESV